MKLFSLLLVLSLSLTAGLPLTGGDYRLEIVVEEPGESWPAVLRLTIDDLKRLRKGAIEYPGERCKGEVADYRFEKGKLILNERIIVAADEYPPGRYILHFIAERLLDPPQKPRFETGYFELQGERYPFRVRAWQYRPTPEAAYRIATRSNGWDDLKHSRDPKALAAYLTAVPDGTFARLAAERLAELLTQRDKFDELLDYLSRFGRYPAAQKVFKAALAQLQADPDWNRIRRLYETAPKAVRPQMAKALRPVTCTDLKGTLAFLRLFPKDDAAVDIGLRFLAQTRDTDLLFKAADLSIPQIRKKAIGRLGHVLLKRRHPRMLARYLRRYCQTPEAAPALAALLKTPALITPLTDTLAKTCRKPTQELLLAMADPLSDRFAATAKAVKKVPDLALPLSRRLAEQVDTLPLSRWAEADALWVLLSRPSLKIEPIDTRSARLVLEDKQGIRLVRTVPVQCRKTGEEEYEAVSTITMLLIIPVGEELARYRRTDYLCRLQTPHPQKVAKKLSLPLPKEVAMHTTRKIAVISKKPNAIGEALLKEANAPGGCKAMRSACLAQCQGKNDANGGFFVSSDKDKCESLCHQAFYECAGK